RADAAIWTCSCCNTGSNRSSPPTGQPRSAGRTANDAGGGRRPAGRHGEPRSPARRGVVLRRSVPALRGSVVVRDQRLRTPEVRTHAELTRCGSVRARTGGRLLDRGVHGAAGERDEGTRRNRRVGTRTRTR